MFTVDFYVNKSDKRKVNKQLDLIQANVVCDLKTPSSIYQPILTLGYINNLVNANYLFIRETKRYYYINDIISHQQRLDIECGDCDVLMSFKQYFKNQTAILDRQSNVFNTYLNDSDILSYAYSNLQTFEFSNSFRTHEEFILICNGGD